MSSFPLIPLGDIADLQAGIGFPVELQGRSSGEYPVAKVGDISRVGRSGEAVIRTADHFVDEGDLARLRAKPIPAGSVLFAKIGEAIRQNHRVIAGCALLVDNNAMAAVPTKKVESRYLYHFLRTVDFYELATATTVPALRKSELKRLLIPLPSLPEQGRIARILDKADALRVKRRASIAQLDTLGEFIYLDMFGDPRRDPIRWPFVPLERVVRDTKLGLVRGSQEVGPQFPFPYVRMNAITRSGELQLAGVLFTHATNTELANYRLEPEDFLFNTRNSEELVGKTALYRGGGVHLFNNNLMRIRFGPEVDPEFVAAAFKTKFIQHELDQRKSGTTNVFAIYYKDLRSVPLPLPPIELQRAFRRRIGAVEKLKAVQRGMRAELDALFASLQHRAFRGEL